VRRETAIAVVVSVVVVGTMAVDHLLGTSDPDEPGLEDPGAFVLSVALALVLVGLFFGRVVRRAVEDEPEASTLKAVAFSLLAVLTLPLIFLAVPFPFAGAGFALGLHAREGRRWLLATAAVVAGAFVLALGVLAYVTALLGEI
jgi:hypothetical protein